MGFRTTRSIFYHIPKTGGLWVKWAIRRSGIPYGRSIKEFVDNKTVNVLLLKREHETPWGVKDIDKKGLFDTSLFSFAFVREPFGWYKSFWAYRKKYEDYFAPAFPLDYAWDENFERFIGNTLEMFPEGFLTDVFKCYVGEDGKALDFVGKQEDLVNDLVKALSLAGETFNEKRLRQTQRANVAAGKRMFDESFSVSKELKQRLMEKEKWVTDTFYK